MPKKIPIRIPNRNPSNIVFFPPYVMLMHTTYLNLFHIVRIVIFSWKKMQGKGFEHQFTSKNIEFIGV